MTKPTLDSEPTVSPETNPGASDASPEKEVAPSVAAQPKKSIIEPIESIAKGTLGMYRNYFDREGGSFPDLFTQDVSARNDCSSYVKHIAVSKGPMLYSDLLTSYINTKIKAKNAERKKAGEGALGESSEGSRQFIEQLLKGIVPTGSFNYDAADDTTDQKKENQK